MFLKGTYDANSSDPPIVESHIRITTNPLKAMFDKINFGFSLKVT